MTRSLLVKLTVSLSTLLALFAITEIAFADNDRDATSEERSKIVEILNAENCQTVGDVEYIQGVGFEAEDVICNDGQEYDIVLDDKLNITTKREDRD